MSTSIGAVLAFATMPVSAMVIGSGVAIVRPPGPQVRSGVQHVAAGVVFAAVAGELLPEVFQIHKPVQVTIGFALGIAVMLLVRELTEGSSEEPGEGDTRSLVTVVGIDLLIDGLLVGIGFAAGTETGILIVIALTLETLFLGVSTAATLGNGGQQSRRVLGTTAGLAAVLAVGATIGAAALQGLSDGWLEVVLGFGAAALLYLVTEELLVEAHEVPETPVTTALFFVGFLCFLLIEMSM